MLKEQINNTINGFSKDIAVIDNERVAHISTNVETHRDTSLDVAQPD